MMCRVMFTSFETLKELYKEDGDFGEHWECCLLKWRNADDSIQKGFLFLDQRLCIPQLSLHLKWFLELHSAGLSGNFGKEKTTALLEERYYWCLLKKEAARFVQRCPAFQEVKGMRKNTGLYTPLPVLSKPWNELSIDFVMELPYTKSGTDSIFMIVDHFSKMSHIFIVCKKTNTANLFFKENHSSPWLATNNHIKQGHCVSFTFLEIFVAKVGNCPQF